MGIDEYTARLLASSILEGGSDGRGGYRPVEDAADAEVSIELRGMVKAIRRSFHLDGSAIAERVAAKCREKMSASNIDALIESAVEGEFQAQVSSIHSTARDIVEKWLRSRLENALMKHSEAVETWASWSVAEAVARMQKARVDG